MKFMRNCCRGKDMEVPLVDLRTEYEEIRHEIDKAISMVIRDTAFVGGKYVNQFEEEFAHFCHTKRCIGVGNGTDALYIALRGLGIGKGDRVITAANSFIATSEAITLTGAEVVFVDCDPITYNIDVERVPSEIRPQTKAIVPVHLYGQPANMPALKNIADKHGLFLLEDAAQAHGAEIHGQRVGGLGDLACFSFYPSKNLGAYGDGGAILTDNEKLAILCRKIADHGRIEKYDHEFEGINSRLDGLQSAILSVKLKHLEAWTEKRRAIAAAYRERLKDSGVITPIEPEGVRHVFHLYVVRVKNRDVVQSILKKRGITTGIHYPVPLPNLQAYRYLGHTREDFPIATKFSEEILSLPMYPGLREEQVEYVCSQLKDAVG
jgi:dTDP-4-amino-4,6-dideoxygalactose transaminase